MTGFKVGDYARVSNFTEGYVSCGRVIKVEGIYIWIDNDPETPYRAADSWKEETVVTLEEQAKSGLHITHEIGNNVEALRIYADTLERLIYECVTLSSVMNSGIEDGEKIYKAIQDKFAIVSNR